MFYFSLLISSVVVAIVVALHSTDTCHCHNEPNLFPPTSAPTLLSAVLLFLCLLPTVNYEESTLSIYVRMRDDLEQILEYSSMVAFLYWFFFQPFLMYVIKCGKNRKT